MLPTQLDLAELALTYGVAQYVLAKLGVLLAFAKVMPTPTTPPCLLAVLLFGARNDWWRGRAVDLGRVRLRLGLAFARPLNIHLGL